MIDNFYKDDILEDQDNNSEKSNYYLDPKNLMVEYENCVKNNECSTKLINYFEIIARHFARTFYYSSKSELDEYVNYAVEEAYIKWHKFNKSRTLNIFSFFTTMIKNDLQTRYNYMNKHKAVHISIETLFTNNKDN
jgi:hypothetical protein